MATIITGKITTTKVSLTPQPNPKNNENKITYLRELLFSIQ